jgi:hypothetical protein
MEISLATMQKSFENKFTALENHMNASFAAVNRRLDERSRNTSIGSVMSNESVLMSQ